MCVVLCFNTILPKLKYHASVYRSIHLFSNAQTYQNYGMFDVKWLTNGKTRQILMNGYLETFEGF